MVSVKAILTSPRSYAILAAAGAITAFIFAEYYDGLLLGGSLYPLGMFQRSVIAMMVGVITALVSFALYIFFASMWEGSFDSPRPARTLRGKDEGGKSYGGGLGQTVETAAVASPVVNGWAGEGHTAGDETGALGTCADGVGEGGDCGGSESEGGGDYGGGGDFGGGGGGGGWS